MAKFFIFKNEELLIKFFSQIKSSSNLKWKEIAFKLNVSRDTLERYRSNSSRIRGDLFYKLLDFIPFESREEILRNVKEVDSKDWLSHGGKMAYTINFEKFREGRKKGVIGLKKYQKTRKNNPKIIPKIDFELSKDICEFIGAFIGDGMFNLYRNKVYHIEFSGDSRKDLDYYQEGIIPIIQSVIPNLKPHIYKVKDRNCIRILFFSKNLFYFLKDGFGFIPGKKTYTVKIPEKIMNSKDEFIYSTIRGIFDTDGCVYFDKREGYKRPYPRIVLQIASEPLFMQLNTYLSKKFKIYSGKNNRNIYYIEIYGFNQLKEWMSKIGFSNKRHLDKIASVA